MQPEVAAMQLAKSLQLAANDYGIELKIDQLPRMATVLMSSFGQLTPTEIATAFEFHLNRKIERVEHFGRFSLDFVSQVLNNYMNYATETLAPVYQMQVPGDEVELTETEKADLDRKAKLEFAEDIRQRGISALHRTHFNPFFYNWFQMANLVPPLTEPNELDLIQGVRTLRSTGRIDVYEMMSGKAEGKVLSEHQRNQIVQNINELFLKEESGVIADRLVGG
jgi:hypothetical protein